MNFPKSTNCLSPSTSYIISSPQASLLILLPCTGMVLSHPSVMPKLVFQDSTLLPQEPFLDPLIQSQESLVHALVAVTCIPYCSYYVIPSWLGISLSPPVPGNSKKQEPCLVHFYIPRTCHAVGHIAVIQPIFVDWLSTSILEWVHNSFSQENDH